MIKNYFKTAWRNIIRNKAFSIINIFGLSIGISAALAIFLIVHYEFSFDKFEKDQNQIYRVVIDAKFNGTEGHSTGIQAPLSNAVQNEVTGVELTVPLMQFQGDATAKVSIAKKSEAAPLVFKNQHNIIFTNPQYFQLLNYKWIAGSQKTALEDPFSVVLTESRARLYFPNLSPQNIIGRQINYNGNLTTTVAGVVTDLGEQTVFNAAEFISYATIAKTSLQNDFMMNVWNDWMAYSQLYIKLSKNTSPERTEAQLKNLLNKYDKDANKDAANTMAFHLQPLSDIHFNSKYPAVGGRIADKSTLYGLLAIAAFLLLLGCINFINLTTAQATQRAKEIGIRKTMGSSREQLIIQFLSETFFITLIAVIISIALAPAILKLFAGFIDPGITATLFQPYLVLFLLVLTIVVSIASGFYPAIMLSGYKPALVLKNQAQSNSSRTRNAWLRKSLTVTQFIIAQFFIMATILVSKQIYYALHKDLGFRKEAILIINSPWKNRTATRNQVFLNKLHSMPQVEMVSVGNAPPSSGNTNSTEVTYYDGKKEIKTEVFLKMGDENYIPLYKIKLLAGRGLQHGDSAKSVIINNTYAKILGFRNPNDAIGKTLKNFNGVKTLQVAGVVADFYQSSLHAPIKPMAIYLGTDSWQTGTFH